MPRDDGVPRTKVQNVLTRSTAPFLHDGRAATLREVLTKHNPKGLHGNVSELSPSELDDLIEYLSSL